ncbi:hypothetical protein CAEBREN_16742 [Caenorhabditis brenneri]|uniref:F-box domain-containing protein n=1 Tax=Caenorhabditis brenneri TaxID=135651 RepID=G0P739_CAEBE|nr:hypothetical protein CAEBREN_16742 [Caenorhabditis brenneri]
MSTSTFSEFFDFFALPNLLREQIFANMCPSALVSLYQTFRAAHTFFPFFNGKMCIKYSLESPKIQVIGSNGKQSILPFTAHKTLSKVYSHLQLVNLSVEINEDSRPENYSDLLKFVGRWLDRDVNTVRVFSKDGNVLDLDSIGGLFDIFESVKVIKYSNKISNFFQSIKVQVVDISNGSHLNTKDIRRVCRKAEEVRISSSCFSDSKFNDIIWDWLNGRNKCLRYLEITSRTRQPQGLRVLMEEIPFTSGQGGAFEAKFLKVKTIFHTGFDIERQDGKRATVVRSAKKFKLIVWN